MLKGEAGGTIKDIEKTDSSANVDTYTITMNDGATYEFEVTNGTSIESIELDYSTGNVDTYAVTLTNGDLFSFDVTNGLSYEVPTNGVVLYDGNSAPEGYEFITNPLSGATTSLKFLKKVSDTAVTGYGEIIDSFNTGDDKETNAPSLRATIERTDNNLLFNSDFITDIYDNGEEDRVRGLGWSTLSLNTEFTSDGLKVGTNYNNTTIVSPRWVGSNISDLSSMDFTYVTLTMVYKNNISGNWITVYRTFNAVTKTPASTTIATINGATVTANIFRDDGKVEITVTGTPTSAFYIKALKLERGTGSTGLNPEARDKQIVKALIGYIDTVKDDIAEKIEALSYQGGDIETVSYRGGLAISYYPSDNSMIIAFSLPLHKVLLDNIESIDITCTRLDIKGLGSNLQSLITSQFVYISNLNPWVSIEIDTSTLALPSGVDDNTYSSGRVDMSLEFSEV
jgi:hypothetical protein